MRELKSEELETITGGNWFQDKLDKAAGWVARKIGEKLHDDICDDDHDG